MTNSAIASVEDFATLLFDETGIPEFGNTSTHPLNGGDLDLDSLDTLHILAVLFEKFGVEIPDQLVPTLLTVQDFYSVTLTAVRHGVDGYSTGRTPKH